MDFISISISRALLLLLLLLLSSWTAALARCLPSQSSALFQLKRGFSLDSYYSNLSSWLRGSDCCSGWEGVACRDPASSGMVTALDLRGLDISGKIDPFLFNLTALVSLDLSYNSFGPAPFPSSFDRLPKLTYLNLSNAGFTGQVPAGISRLTNLVSLDLSTFYDEEEPDSILLLRNPDLPELIRNFGSLRELYLDGVNISADGIEWCRAVSGSAPNLEKLSMVGCSLSGPIDASLSGLSSLAVLRLDHNNFNSEMPEFFGNFSSLSQLHLKNCGLKGPLPANIFQPAKLTAVDLSNNERLRGNLPEFPNDSALQRLELYDCGFTGRISASIGNLTQLIHLDLSSNNFSGEIPSDVSWGAGISHIDLAFNNLNGSIPSSFGDRLHNLTWLDLRTNLLSGSIPVSLFTLPALQSLLLSQNQLSGHLGEFLNASPTLFIADLNENVLQGEIPRSIFNLYGLNALALGSNNFSGTLKLNLFGSLTNLSDLDLSNNRLSIQDGEDSSLSLLKFGTLKLVACNLTKLPDFLRHQQSMEVLDLSNNIIGGTIPQWIWTIGSTTLTYLNLSHNLFTDVGLLPELSTSSNSITLDLHSNRLQGHIPLPPFYTDVLDYSNNFLSSSIPSNISYYLNFTKFFSVSNNSLNGAIPLSVCKAINIQVLDFSDNYLNGSIPTCLMDGSINLNVLNLGKNQFHGTMPHNISDQCALQTINLNDNQIEGNVPRSLNNCKMLEVLDIGNNHIVDTFPFWLSSLSKLRVLSLKSNEFYGHINYLLASNVSSNIFPMLQIFDISSNYFNGSLPLEFFTHFEAMMVVNLNASSLSLGFTYLPIFTSPVTGTYLGFNYRYLNFQDTVTVMYKGIETTLVKILTIFTSIDISNNMFVGSIPESIGKLKLLNMLNMSHNSFEGLIPQSTVGMKQLESLDLSSNHLSGKIPEEMIDLTFLALLNLSNNSLVGRIPQGGQFLTFDSSAFDGNEELCGRPLPKPCNDSPIATAPLGGELPSRDGRKTDMVVLGIFTGSGFGVGLSVAILLVLMLQRKRRHESI